MIYFSKMLTTPKSKKKSENLWPSLSAPSTSTAAPSFFEDKKITQITSSKGLKAQPITEKDDESDVSEEEDGEKFKSPALHQLGDCLANALAKQMQFGVSKSGKKKKTKKTLLFSSGMNFN
jgi:hypothetical protein